MRYNSFGGLENSVQMEDRKPLVIAALVLLAGLLGYDLVAGLFSSIAGSSGEGATGKRKTIVMRPRFLGEDGGIIVVSRSREAADSEGILKLYGAQGVTAQIVYENGRIMLLEQGTSDGVELSNDTTTIGIRLAQTQTVIFAGTTKKILPVVVDSAENVLGRLDSAYFPPGSLKRAADDFMRVGNEPGDWDVLLGRWELTALSHPDRSANPFHLAFVSPGPRWEDPIFSERIDIKRYGVGALIGQMRGLPAVSRLSGNGPAARAGVEEEDIVLSAQGYGSSRRSFRGMGGDKVQFNLLRLSSGKILNIAVPKEPYRWGESTSPVPWSGGSDSSDGLAAIGRPDWAEGRIEVSVAVDRNGSAGLAFRIADKSDFSAIVLSGSGEIQFVRVRSGRREVVTQQTVPVWPGSFYRLGVTLNAAEVSADVDGVPVLKAPLEDGFGRVGLWASASAAVRSAPPRPPFFDDFIFSGRPEDVSGEQAPEPPGGRLLSDETSLRDWANPAGQWLYDGEGFYKFRYPVFRNALILVGGITQPIPIAIAPEGASPTDTSAIRFVISPGDAPARIRVGESSFSIEKLHGDPESPLPESVSKSLWREIYVGIPQDLSPSGIVNVIDEGACDESFDKAPVSLLFTGGFWGVANKWICDPRFSYLSTRSGELASAWWKGQITGDFTADYYIATFMEMLDDPFERSGDYNLSLATEPGNLGSGYTLSVGEDYDNVSRLRRGGKVLAETFDINHQPPSDHLFLPTRQDFHRHWTHVRLSRRGSEFTYEIDGRKAFSVKDPDPINSPLLPVLWAQRNSFLLGRFRVTGEISPGLKTFDNIPAPARLYDDGRFTNLWAGVPSASVEPSQDGLLIRQPVSGPFLVTMKQSFRMPGRYPVKIRLKVKPLSSSLAIGAYILPADAPGRAWQEEYGDGETMDHWPATGRPPWQTFRPRLYDDGMLGFIPVFGGLSEEPPFIPLKVISSETAADGTVAISAEARLPASLTSTPGNREYCVALGCLHRLNYAASGLSVNPPGSSYVLQDLSIDLSAVKVQAAKSPVPGKSSTAGAIPPSHTPENTPTAAPSAENLGTAVPSTENADTAAPAGEKAYTVAPAEDGAQITAPANEGAQTSTPLVAPATPSAESAAEATPILVDGRYIDISGAQGPLLFALEGTEGGKLQVLMPVSPAEEEGAEVTRYDLVETTQNIPPGSVLRLTWRSSDGQRKEYNLKFDASAPALVAESGPPRVISITLNGLRLDAIDFTDPKASASLDRTDIVLLPHPEDGYTRLALSRWGGKPFFRLFGSGATVESSILSLIYRADRKVAFSPSFERSEISLVWGDGEDRFTEWAIRANFIDAVPPVPFIADSQWHIARFNLPLSIASAGPDAFNTSSSSIGLADIGWQGMMVGMGLDLKQAALLPIVGQRGLSVDFTFSSPEISSYHLSVDDTDVIVNRGNTGPFPLRDAVLAADGIKVITLDKLPDGVHELSLTVAGPDSKWSAPFRRSFVLDTTPPDVFFIPEQPEAAFPLSIIAGHFIIKDSVSGFNPEGAALSVSDPSGRPLETYTAHNGLDYDVSTGVLKITRPVRPKWCLLPGVQITLRGVRDVAGNEAVDFGPLAVTRDGTVRTADKVFRKGVPENAAPQREGLPRTARPPVVFFEPQGNDFSWGPKGLPELLGAPHYFNYSTGQLSPLYNVKVSQKNDAGLGDSGGGVLESGPGEWRVTLYEQFIDTDTTDWFVLSYKTTPSITKLTAEARIVGGDTAFYDLPITADGAWHTVLLDLAAAYRLHPVQIKRMKIVTSVDLVGFTEARLSSPWPAGTVCLDAYGSARGFHLRIHPFPGEERARLFQNWEGLPDGPIPADKPRLPIPLDAKTITIYAVQGDAVSKDAIENSPKAIVDCRPIQPR
jgi:hypothetical protein